MFELICEFCLVVKLRKLLRLICGNRLVVVMLMLVVLVVRCCLVVWMFGWWCSSLLGLLIGRVLVIVGRLCGERFIVNFFGCWLRRVVIWCLVCLVFVCSCGMLVVVVVRCVLVCSMLSLVLILVLCSCLVSWCDFFWFFRLFRVIFLCSCVLCSWL